MRHKNELKIVFFGSGRFAVGILQAVRDAGARVELVVTQPDRKKGRHLQPAPTPVKEYGIKHRLEIFQPDNVNAAQNVAFLKDHGADVYVVVSYGRILRKEVLDLPTKLCVNIHASLLPKYRGAAPINRALISGATKTGVTFIKMNEAMDQGDIIFQRSLKIGPGDDALTLDDKLSKLAAGSVNRVLGMIIHGRLRLKKQDDRKASYAALMRKQDGLIDWTMSAGAIINQFRGCTGWPGTYTRLNGKIIKILEVRQTGRWRTKGSPGQVVRAHDNILEIACGKGRVAITQVLPESHRMMSVKSFLAGHPLKAGDLLGR